MKNTKLDSFSGMFPDAGLTNAAVFFSALNLHLYLLSSIHVHSSFACQAFPAKRGLSSHPHFPLSCCFFLAFQRESFHGGSPGIPPWDLQVSGERRPQPQSFYTGVFMLTKAHEERRLLTPCLSLLPIIWILPKKSGCWTWEGPVWSLNLSSSSDSSSGKLGTFIQRQTLMPCFSISSRT